MGNNENNEDETKPPASCKFFHQVINNCLEIGNGCKLVGAGRKAEIERSQECHRGATECHATEHRCFKDAEGHQTASQCEVSKVRPQVLQGQPFGGASEAARWEEGKTVSCLPEIFQLELPL